MNPSDQQINEQGAGVAFWRKRLGLVRLPVLSDEATRAALLQPDASGQQIGDALRADLPLALETILQAAALPRIQGDVQGLQHALGVLGVERVQALVRTRVGRLFNPAIAAHQACLQAISVSCFAAMLVQDWEPPHPDGESEYLRWVTLLLGLARWKLPLIAPDLCAQIERRARLGERRAVVERELLGCTMDALNAAVLQEAGFPTDAALLKSVLVDGRLLSAAARHAWTGGMAPELPIDVARRLRRHTTVCMLGHLLAWSAHDGWYSPRTRLLMRVVSAHTNQPLERVIGTIHQVAVRASRASAFAGRVFLPAQQLFWRAAPPRRLRRAPVVAPAGAAVMQAAVTTVPAAGLARTRAVPSPQELAPGCAHAVPPAVDPVEDFFQNCLHGRFPDLHAFMVGTGQALKDGLGLNRCLLFLKLANADELGCYYAHGFDGHVAARKFTVPAHDNNLLGRMFQHVGGALWVNAARVPAGRQQLPEKLKPHVVASGFLLGTIQLKDRPVGVIWADSGCAEQAPQAQQYARFRHMIEHFGSEFTRLTQVIKR